MGNPTRPLSKEKGLVAASIDGAGLLENDVFVTVNEKLSTIYGFVDTDGLVGTKWKDLYPAAERERIETEVLPRVRDGRGWRGEAKGVGPDGTTFEHILSIQPLETGRYAWVVRELGGHTTRTATPRGTTGHSPGGTRVQVGSEDPLLALDRTDEGVGDDEGVYGCRHRNHGVSSSENWLLAETAPVPIVVITDERGIVYGSRKAVDLLGADDRTDIVGEEPERFVHPDQHDRITEQVRLAVEDREATEPTEYRLTGLDETERFCEIATAPMTYEGEPAASVVVEDITSYRRSQERLRRERQFLETVIDAIDDVFYVIDGDGESYRWNEALVEVTGYSHEEIEAMAPMELIPEDQREHVPGLMEATEPTDDHRVELDIRTRDGERIPHEFKWTTFEDPATGEQFRCGTARDVTERLEREQTLERYRTIVETVDDGVYAMDENLQFSFVSDRLCEMVDMDRSELLGNNPMAYFDYEDDRAVAADIRERVVDGDLTTGTAAATYTVDAGERRHFEARYRLYPEPDGEFRGSVGVVRDVTEREARERELEQQRDELATFDRINRILLETTRELIRSADRDVIERTVCTQLSDSDLYQLAWIGERAVDGDGFVPRTIAGDDRGFLDAIATKFDGDEGEGNPARRAIRSGHVQVLSSGTPGSDPWQDVASECGFESIAAIPLHHDDTVYGALMIHTERENAFTDHEQDGFDVLGRTVGYIINAVKHRKLLFTDTVLELEFSIADADSVLIDTAFDLDCELVLDGYFSSEQQWILYVEIDGGSVDEVVAAAAEDQRVERARDVSVTESEGRVELVVTDASLIRTITRAGGSLSTATFCPGDTRLVVEIPADADVREMVDHVQREHPNVDFVAQRERDHEVSAVGRPDGVLGRLTDRQREALEAAYRAGYFSWPRTSTAEEVAESLNLTSATLHGHLRKAEGTILTKLFEGK